jgi:phosphoesterase RecJ-like protein
MVNFSKDFGKHHIDALALMEGQKYTYDWNSQEAHGFDTNYFKFIRSSATPHLIAAELLRFPIEPELIHRHLFGNHSQAKLSYVGQILNKIEYDFDGKLACVKVHRADLDKHGLESEETNDIIDLIMNIKDIEAAVLFREDGPNQFKLSFRSRGIFNVSHLAQSLGGGGHKFSSGTTIQAPYEEIKKLVTDSFKKLFAL